MPCIVPPHRGVAVLSPLLLVVALLACRGGGKAPVSGVDTGAGADSGSGLVDADGDGYAAAPDGDDGDDCDDANVLVHPGATETCGDGVDQDCDGTELGCTGTMPATAGGGYLQGDELTQGVGRSIRVLPDWTGGEPVIAVGTPAWAPDGQGYANGAVFFVDPRNLGTGQAIESRASWAWTEAENSADFGWALDIGDLDQDGVTDMLIGTPEAAYDHPDGKGGAWLVYGPETGSGEISEMGDVHLTGARSLMEVGFAVRFAQDAAGDGSSDVVLGWNGGCRDDGLGASTS